MANKKKKEETVARELFINTQMTQKDIAEQLNISPTTVVKWAALGKWDELRDGKQSTTSQTVAILKGMFKTMVEKNKEKLDNNQLTPGDMDAQIKLKNQIEDVEQSLSIPTIIEVLDRFLGFIPKSEKEFRKELAGWQTKFLMDKLNG